MGYDPPLTAAWQGKGEKGFCRATVRYTSVLAIGEPKKILTSSPEQAWGGRGGFRSDAEPMALPMKG